MALGSMDSGQAGGDGGHLLTAVLGDGLCLSVRVGGDLNCSDGHNEGESINYFLVGEFTSYKKIFLAEF